jgi:hypothetical protein
MLYLSHGLTLKVNTSNSETASYLDQLLRDLSWARTDRATTNPSICLSVGLDGCNVKIPTTARELFRADGFCGFEIGDDFYLSDGSTTFHQHPLPAQGDVFLSPSFFAKPFILQRSFWAFALVKLLRSLSIFSLHAAGVTRHGRGVLIVGSPGSGKSTLAIGLVRLGWKYLSDDALLLRAHSDRIEALAFRKSFYVNTDAALDYAEFPLGDEVPDSYGGTKRRLNIEEVYPAQHEQRCDPRVLLFSRIVSDSPSYLVPIDRVIALRNLLKQCSPQLFDQRTMGEHLRVLGRLVRQTTSYELSAGLDLYRDPGRLMYLLAGCEQDERWLD